MGNDISTPEKGQGFFCDSYADDVSPLEALKFLEQNDGAVLVDVRTLPEWTFVGVPDLSRLGRNTICLSWLIYPNMAVNGEFCHQLSKIVADIDTPIFFICRSGHRSMDAAIETTRYGYKNCYNITGGFEGDLNENGHRARKNGWKLDNLPWRQN